MSRKLRVLTDCLSRQADEIITHYMKEKNLANVNTAFSDLVYMELKRARMKHREPIYSFHEGFSIIHEEFDELKAEVWKQEKKRDKAHMLEELVQVAAMAQRMAEDTGLV